MQLQTEWNVTVALALAGVFAALAAVHVYWAVGNTPAGGAAVPTRADGQPLFRPSRATTMAVALLLLAAAGVMLGKVGILPPVGSMMFYRVGPWVIGGVLLLRTIGDFRYVGLFKREPICAVRFPVLYAAVCTAFGRVALRCGCLTSAGPAYGNASPGTTPRRNFSSGIASTGPCRSSAGHPSGMAEI